VPGGVWGPPGTIACPATVRGRMDPVIQQIARARSIEPHFLRKMKEHFIHVVQPQLNERERLLEENARLREENARLSHLADQPAEGLKVARRREKAGV
jgi:hypothetical protein